MEAELDDVEVDDEEAQVLEKNAAKENGDASNDTAKPNTVIDSLLKPDSSRRWHGHRRGMRTLEYSYQLSSRRLACTFYNR